MQSEVHEPLVIAQVQVHLIDTSMHLRHLLQSSRRIVYSMQCLRLRQHLGSSLAVESDVIPRRHRPIQRLLHARKETWYQHQYSGKDLHGIHESVVAQTVGNSTVSAFACFKPSRLLTYLYGCYSMTACFENDSYATRCDTLPETADDSTRDKYVLHDESATISYLNQSCWLSECTIRRAH